VSSLDSKAEQKFDNLDAMAVSELLRKPPKGFLVLQSVWERMELVALKDFSNPDLPESTLRYRQLQYNLVKRWRQIPEEIASDKDIDETKDSVIPFFRPNKSDSDIGPSR